MSDTMVYMHLNAQFNNWCSLIIACICLNDVSKEEDTKMDYVLKTM